MLQAFLMTVVGEWGDRSQVAAVGLAASKTPLAVCLGGIAGQAVALALATVGGRELSHMISERTMGLFGGLLFLAFSLGSAWELLEVWRATGAV